MDKTIVFMDDGFLAKLSKHFGEGNYLKFNKTQLAENLAKKEDLDLMYMFYYTAPPFQSQRPSKEQIIMKENYDRFKKKLLQSTKTIVREGRVQRLKLSQDDFIYKQKAVDSLMIIDLMSIPLEHKEVKKIIIIACDSDFVPAIEYLKKLSIKTILYTYYEKGRSARFSTSNELITTVYKYVLLTKEDFLSAQLPHETEVKQ